MCLFCSGLAGHIAAQGQAWVHVTSRTDMRLTQYGTGTERSLTGPEAFMFSHSGHKHVCMRPGTDQETHPGLGGPVQGQITGRSPGAALQEGPFSHHLSLSNISQRPKLSPLLPTSGVCVTAGKRGCEPGNWMGGHEKLLIGSGVPSPDPTSEC